MSRLCSLASNVSFQDFWGDTRSGSRMKFLSAACFEEMTSDTQSTVKRSTYVHACRNPGSHVFACFGEMCSSKRSDVGRHL